jgi:hypothetical protein
MQNLLIPTGNGTALDPDTLRMMDGVSRTGLSPAAPRSSAKE